MSTPETARAAEQAAAGPSRSTAHYVFVLIVVLLMGETTTYAAVGFTTVLPHMVPPFTPTQLPWIFSITLLVAAAVQPLMGKLADVFGRKQMLMAVVVLFVLGSLLGALTTSFTLTIVARVLQASAVALPGVVYSFFREYLPARMVPIAVGMSSTTTGIALLAAPLIAGALLNIGDYRMVFWFCFAYMLVFGSLAAIVVPSKPRVGKRPSLRQVDLAGSLLFTLGAGALLLGITNGGSDGWGSAAAVVPLVASAVLLVGFVVVEGRVREPMIPLRLLRGPALGLTLLVAFFGFLPLIWTYVAPQMLESTPTPGADYAFGLSVTEVGIVTLGFGVTNMIFGPLGGYIARRTSPRTVMMMCVTLGALSSLLTAFLHNHLWHYVVFGAIGGIASGCFYGAVNNLIIEAVPERLTGVATGMGSFVAAFTASAIPVVISVILAGHALPGGGHTPVYASEGYMIVFLIFAASALLSLLLTARMRHGRAPASGGAAAH